MHGLLSLHSFTVLHACATHIGIGWLLQTPPGWVHWSDVQGLPSSQVMTLCRHLPDTHKSPVQALPSLQSNADMHCPMQPGIG